MQWARQLQNERRVVAAVYVSITGLTVKHGLPTLRFWWLTLPAMAQAKRAPGNISADARSIDGVQHTLTVWTDKAAMRAYMLSGAHKKAMLASRSIGSGKVCGFEMDHAPSWHEARALWREHGREV
jgi:hypothetical protein